MLIVIVTSLCFFAYILLVALYGTSIYLMITFSKRMKRDTNYFPKVAVFLPCKDNYKSLRQNLESVLNQDYKGEYKVFYIVESEADPAFTVIKDIIKNSKKSELIIAGKAGLNSQKNHNILYTINRLDNENRNDFEVYAFFDSDHYAPEHWLRTLVQTLTMKDVEIATLHSIKQPDKILPLGTIVYSMLINYICNFNTLSNQAWGGSLAMKKETYLKHNIRNIWQVSVSHDCPLNGVKAKLFFNPECSPVETDFSYTLSGFIKWSTRQFTNWKHFSIGLWCLSFFNMLFNLAILYSFVVLAIMKIFFKTEDPLFSIFGWYLLLSYITVSFFVSYRTEKKIYWFLVDFLSMPLFLTTTFISFVKSIFNNKIKWGNKSYIIVGKGKVSDIKEIAN